MKKLYFRCLLIKDNFKQTVRIIKEISNSRNSTKKKQETEEEKKKKEMKKSDKDHILAVR